MKILACADAKVAVIRLLLLDGREPLQKTDRFVNYLTLVSPVARYQQ
jgi:hypothetical protein